MNQSIQLKCGEQIMFSDVIELTDKQIEILTAVASSKTKHEWMQTEIGQKITLEQDQIDAVLGAKAKILGGKSVEEIIDNDLISLPSTRDNHARQRIVYRLQGGHPTDHLKPEVFRKFIQALIDSNEVSQIAEWKGRSTLTYNFKCPFEGGIILVAVTFKNSMIIITVMTDKKNRPKNAPVKKDFGHKISELLSGKDIDVSQIKSMIKNHQPRKKGKHGKKKGKRP